jgi:hypothetical protein
MHNSGLVNNSLANTNIVLIIPTYNAGPLWEKCIERIKNQVNIQIKVLVVDSSSSDNWRPFKTEEKLDGVNILGGGLSKKAILRRLMLKFVYILC